MHKAAVALIIALVAASCSIHPLPENVTFLRTTDIVHQIRCEARRAVFHVFRDYINEFDDRRSRSLLRDFDINPEMLAKLDYGQLSSEQRTMIEKYDDTAVVLDFQLKMTETDNLSGGTTLVRPFTMGSDLIGLKIGDNRTRYNFRTFRITDSFKEIVRNLRDCSVNVPGENLQYPITGEVGLYEIFSTYLRLNRTAQLSNVTGFQIPALVDTLMFTTDVSGEIDPSFSLIPTEKRFVQRDASGLLGGDRKDEHQLTVGVMLPPEVAPAAAVSQSGAEAKGQGRKRLANRQPNRAARAKALAVAKGLLNQAVSIQSFKLNSFGLNPLVPFAPLQTR